MRSWHYAAVLFVVAACAKQGELSIEELDKKNVWGFSAKVTCANENACPNEVAMIAYPDPDEKTASWCSGTMIGEQTMLTNAHCIPIELRKATASCENEMWVAFPQTKDHKPLVVECAQVITIAPHFEDDDDPRIDVPTAKADYALIRLKRAPGRGFIKLSRDGFRENSSVTFYKSNPQFNEKKQITGVIEKRECTVKTSVQVKEKLLASSSDSHLLKTLKTIVLEDCEARGGNSGTAAIVDGHIHGVLFGGGRKDGIDQTIITNFGYPDINLFDHLKDALFKLELNK